MVKLWVIYYSATGHGTAMAECVAQTAESSGADVRTRHVEETRNPDSSLITRPARPIMQPRRMIRQRLGMTSLGQTP